MTENIKTTIIVPRSLWKELQIRCIQLDISAAEGVQKAIQHWLRTGGHLRVMKTEQK